MVEAAEAVYGRTAQKRKVKETRWWNERVKTAVKKKNESFREWFRNRTEEAREKYKRLKRETIRIVGEEKRVWLEKWTDLLEEDTTGIKKVLYSLVKKNRKGKVERVEVMVDENGKRIENDEELKELCRRYFEKLLNPRDGENDITNDGNKVTIERRSEEESDLT